MVNVNEMRRERAALIHKAQDIYNRCKEEKREPTGEENRKFDLLMAQSDVVYDKVLDAERNNRKPDAVGSFGYVETKEHPEYRAAFDGYLRMGETRALQGDVNPSGGYLVLPQKMAEGVLKALDDILVIRQLATKHTLPNAASLGVPYLENDPADAVWTSELATGNEDTSMSFGKRELMPRPIAKRLKVSTTLLRQVPSAAAFVESRLAYKFGVTCDKAFMTGTGANQPLGLFTASSEGIPTSRDVSTGNTSTAITMDGLINAAYALKGQYLKNPGTRWLFHRDALKQIRKMRDDSGGAGTGTYIWQPSTQAGQPDLLLGIPVMSSEYCPNTFTTGQYVGMIADFSYYWIADALSMTVKRLDELYAEANQTGFIGRLETDAMPVLAEAFVRIKLA
jgi:HK97 family phage major capsid protein